VVPAFWPHWRAGALRGKASTPAFVPVTTRQQQASISASVLINANYYTSVNGGGKENRRRLNQEPRYDRVSDRNFVNIAPLQFGEELLHCFDAVTF